MAQVSFIAPQNALNGVLPCEGPKALPYTMDFSLADEYDFDFTQQYQQNVFTSVQCAYVDNSLNGQNTTIIVNGTGQQISVPANSQGYFTLLAVPAPKFAVASAGAGVLVQIIFLNFYIPPTVWAV